MDEQANVLEINGLVKRYGAKTAVNGISFRIRHGEIVGFLGPNGAGKSTVMNMITGYLSPTEGTVLVNGKNVVEEPIEAKKCIGYLPELPPLYFDMTVKEYLDFVCGLKGVKKNKDKHIEMIMDTVHIDDVSGRLIKNLSKGYRQRVGLAEALIGNPDLIILDEPTVGLDPSQIMEFREIIKDIGKSRTVILSTHILQEVNAVCDRVIIINHGEIVADDTLDNLENGSEKSVNLTVKGTSEQCCEVVSECETAKITSVKETDGYTQLVLCTADTDDVRERLFFDFANRGLAIVEMTQSRSNLEDIFIDITNGTYVKDFDDESSENVSDAAADTGAEDDEHETDIQSEAADSDSEDGKDVD